MSNGEVRKRNLQGSGEKLQESMASAENDPLVRPSKKQDGESKVDDYWDLEDDDDWVEGQTPAERPAEEEEDVELTRKRRVLKRDVIEVGVSLFFHLVILCVYIAIHVYDATIVRRTGGRGFEGAKTYGGRWKFLTYCNLWVQFIYYFLSFFTDIMPWSTAKYWFLKACDIIFTTVAIPMTMFVVAMFWGIFWLDREMVHPKELDEHVPLLLNHCWHTFPIFFLLLENIFVFHRYPGNMRATQILFVVSTLYIVWISWVYTIARIIPYPFFRLMPLPALPIFFAVSFIVFVVFYFIGKWFCYLRWKERHDLMDEMGL